MVERIYHVGLTVSDLDRSIAFYRDILGLEFQGEIFMAGEETDRLFRMKDTKARVAYLNGSKAIEAPPIELIQFVDNKVKKVKGNLFTTSISEVCFYTNDIERVYNSLTVRFSQIASIIGCQFCSAITMSVTLPIRLLNC